MCKGGGGHLLISFACKHRLATIIALSMSLNEPLRSVERVQVPRDKKVLFTYYQVHIVLKASGGAAFCNFIG